MLSSPDSELCRRDPAIRGLETLLEPELLKSGVARAGTSLPLTDFVPSYLRYKPGTNCIVGFSSADSPRTIAFYGKAYALGSGKPKESSPAFDRSRGRIVLVSDGIELFIFPADAKLDLTGVPNPTVSWRANAEELNKESGTDDDVSIETLTWRPERRCVFAKTVKKRTAAVIKAYSPVEFSRTLLRARALEASGSGLFPVLQSADEARRYLIFSWSHGDLLQRSLENGSALLPDFVRTGEQLAALHAMRMEALAVRSHEEEAEQLSRSAAMIGRLCPNLADASAATAKRIAQELLKMPAGESTLHGDFGAKQVVSSGESIAFLDFDEAARGNAASDLGNFIARLEADAQCGTIRSELVAPVRAALMSGYQSTARLPSERELSVHTAVGLFRVALEPFRRHDRDWPVGIEQSLDRVLAILDGSIDPCPVATTGAGLGWR